ncbi:MAG: type II and III secretion system protein family protein [Pseudomonadota bacterium]
MNIPMILRATLLGVLVLGAPVTDAYAQTLRLSEGAAQSALRVPLNRAIVLESDVPFAELSVANPLIADIATLSERTVYVLGKAPGRTTLTLLGPDGRLITNVEVQVTPDIAEFKERLQELLPNEPIEVRTANDGIVLSGTVSSGQVIDQAVEVANRYAPDAVLNLMNVGNVQQVQLKVRFAEMSRSVTKELGASVAVSAPDGSFIGGGTPLTSPNGVLTFGFGAGSLSFDVLIEALETKGVVRTLAEPNLTALSGQTASFLAGGEVPIPIQAGEDGGQVSVQYRPFGVDLQFQPTVVADDVINLQLNASVSALDAASGAVIDGAFVTGFSTRTTTTSVELRDGQSFAIAGLLQDDFADTISQVPFLGDLPILGALFRSAAFERDQTELVVIVSAHLVSPTRGEALALPTDRIRPPTENELFLFGQPVRRSRDAIATSTRGGEAAAQDFTGNYGYVLD